MDNRRMLTSTQGISRRAMLCRSAQALAFTVTAGRLAPLLAAPASRWFKIGACDWALDKRSDTGAFDVAKEIGLDGVQIDLGTPANGMHLPQAAAPNGIVADYTVDRKYLKDVFVNPS